MDEKPTKMIWGEYPKTSSMEMNDWKCKNCGGRVLDSARVDLFDKYGTPWHSFDSVSECAKCGSRFPEGFERVKKKCPHIGLLPIENFTCTDCGEPINKCNCFESFGGVFCEACNDIIEESEDYIREMYMRKRFEK